MRPPRGIVPARGQVFQKKSSSRPGRARSMTNVMACAGASPRTTATRAPGPLHAEDAPCDMTLAAIDLQRIILAVEVVDAADLARLDFPGVRVPEVPAAAVIADDQLVAPGLPA